MDFDPALLSACRSLPKVEVHAHLHGSIRSTTLLELADAGGCLADIQPVLTKAKRTLADCFRLFDVIHLLTQEHSIVKRIAEEVVLDFAAENVIYLELRTTPKSSLRPSPAMTKRSYLDAVLAGLQAGASSSPNKIQVRLLLSVDRREDEEAAMETVRLAEEMKAHGTVVGVDLSGNPCVGEWRTWLPALTWARSHGLRVTLHCGEVAGREQEVQAMLEFMPDRVGHVCCLGDEEWNLLLASCIPVEVCITSNLLTRSVAALEDHHFAQLHRLAHPLLLCTDDAGVFSTSLSMEYALAASCSGLTLPDLVALAEKSIHHIFGDSKLKEDLQRRFQDQLAVCST